jgi:hypothetical protein
MNVFLSSTRSADVTGSARSHRLAGIQPFSLQRESDSRTETAPARVAASPLTPFSGSLNANLLSASHNPVAGTANIPAPLDFHADNDQLGPDAINSVNGCLDEAGLGTCGLKLSYERQKVGYQGGGYINHVLHIEAADGRTLDLAADLAYRSPWLAACEINRFLNEPANA